MGDLVSFLFWIRYCSITLTLVLTSFLYPCLRSLCSSEYRDLLPSFGKEDSLVDAGQLSDSSKEFAHCLIQVSQLFK